MTLADLIRSYLEDRRKVCEQKAKFLEPYSDNFQFYTDHEEGSNVIPISNDHFFSNNIDPKSNDQWRGSNSKTYQKHVGVSKRSRITNLPDGTIQVETIIRHSDGNEEKHVTVHKNGKKYTTITRKTPSGDEIMEQKVGDDIGAEVFSPSPFNDSFFSRSQNRNLDSGYDYWFNKFFRSENSNSKDGFINDITPLDPNADVEEHIEKLLKGFGFEGIFGPFSSMPRNKNIDDSTSFDNGVFNEFNDSSLNEEIKKTFDNFEVTDFNLDDGQIKKENKKMKKQMDKIFKSITPPKPPSIFEQFAKDALVELPEEKTPFDKFVEPDEDKLEQLRPIWRKSRDMIEKLEKYLSNHSNTSDDIYSDIEDPKDLDLSLMLPQPEPILPPNLNNFGNIFQRNFGTNSPFQMHMFFNNGEKRTVSVKKDAEGNIHKNILYEVDNKKYNLEIVTSPSGKQIKRERTYSFPESELPKFKSRWNKQFHSDFDD